MKKLSTSIGHVVVVLGIVWTLSNAAFASNIMPSFSTVTPTPNPSGWGEAGAVLGIDFYSLDKIDGFQGRDNVLEVNVPAAASEPSPSLLQTVGGEHAVIGGVGSQLEAYLWVPGGLDSWETNTGPDGTVDTDMLGIMPLDQLDPTDLYSYFPAIGFSNESGVGTFKVWDASRTSPTDPTPNYSCGYPGEPTCWVNLDGNATDRGGSTVPNAPVRYDAWNKLSIDFPQPLVDINGDTTFYITYSVNDMPVYTAIMDILGLYNPSVVSSTYGFTAAQMRGLYLGSDYTANWANVDEPASLTLATIGLCLMGINRLRRNQINAT